MLEMGARKRKKPIYSFTHCSQVRKHGTGRRRLEKPTRGFQATVDVLGGNVFFVCAFSAPSSVLVPSSDARSP